MGVKSDRNRTRKRDCGKESSDVHSLVSPAVPPTAAKAEYPNAPRPDHIITMSSHPKSMMVDVPSTDSVPASTVTLPVAEPERERRERERRGVGGGRGGEKREKQKRKRYGGREREEEGGKEEKRGREGEREREREREYVGV